MADKQCEVDGCDRMRRTNKYCSMHQRRWAKTGDPGPAESRYSRAGTSCSVEGCPEPHCALSLCNTHYARLKSRGERPASPIRRLGEAKEPCIRAFCQRPQSAKGLCIRHYGRLQLFRKYESGFSYERYDDLFDTQSGGCAICDKALAWDAKSTHVDHDHVIGMVRGLLCSGCNQGLGSFSDDAGRLEKAARYLRCSADSPRR